MSKAYDNAKELEYIEFDSSNNKLNFTVDISSNNTVIGGADDFARIQANAAFDAANTGLVRQSFLANTGQTDFITNGYTIGYVDVFVNGLKLYDAEDFVATDGTNVSVIQPELSSNDVVEIISHGNNPSVVARVDQFARDFVNNAWSAANSAYDFANSVYSLANNAANSAASSIPLTGSDNISGNLTPDTTNTYYLGSETNRWHSLYVGPGSIDLGGLILSNVGGTLAVSTSGQEPTPLNVSTDAIANGTSNVKVVSSNGNVEITIDGTTQTTISSNLVSHNEGVLENVMYRVNSPNITSDIVISSTYNYMSVGPITINSGVTVNVASGARWAIV